MSSLLSPEYNISAVAPFDFIRAARLLRECRARKKRNDWMNRPGYRESQRPYHADYVKAQWKSNPQLAVKNNFHRAVRYMLVENWTRGKWVQIIGLTGAELRAHFERQFVSGMTWENRGGPDGWQVDCRIPCSNFDLTNPEQAAKCFHYSNLQPLWRHQNQNKETALC